MKKNATASRGNINRKHLSEDNESTALCYIEVRDRVERYMKPEHGMQIHILSIEEIRNPNLDSSFLNACKSLNETQTKPRLLFHGTTTQNAERIIKEGFKVGNGGMFGAGIYFATDSTKSAQYCRDSDVKSLLLCDVALGKPKVCDAPQSSLTLGFLRSIGYDSVYAKRNTKGTGGVLNDEFIVYRPEQATPRYLVKFRTSNLAAKTLNQPSGANTSGANTSGANTSGANTSGNNTSGNNTSGNNTRGNNTSGNNTSGNNTSGNNTSGNNTSGNNTSGANPDSVINFIIVAVLFGFMALLGKCIELQKELEKAQREIQLLSKSETKVLVNTLLIWLCAFMCACVYSGLSVLQKD